MLAAEPQVRALLYDRVSTLHQARSGHSGGADGFQLDRCRAYADTRRFACVGELTDVDSGAEWNIDGIMQALERAKRREYDVLIVSDTSRFARNLAKKTVYEAELRRYGVTVVYLNLPVNDGPEGRFISNVFGALDELERERISWRTQQGKLMKARKGQVVGGGPAPYGHQYVTAWDETKRKDVPIGLAPKPETAEIVRRLYHDLVFWSAIDLARKLTDEGVPTPTGKSRRWGNSTIRRILMSPVHKGEWHYDGIAVPVPPLVDVRTWEDAQVLLAERSRARRGRDPECDALYELRGLLTCGHCGGAISTSSNTTGRGQPHRQRVYVCLRHQPRRARDAGWDVCRLPMFLASAGANGEGSTRREMVGIEDHAWDLVASIMLDAARLQAELNRLSSQHADAHGERAQRLKILDGEIASHERTLRRASEEKLKVDDDDARYSIYDDAERREAETVRRLRVERDRFSALPTPGMNDDEAAALTQAAADVRAGIEHAGPADRRRVYQILRLRGKVFHDPERGVPIGYRGRFRIEWDALISLDSEHSAFTSSM